MSAAETPGPRGLPPALRGLLVLAALYLFAIAVTLMGSAFKLVGREPASVLLTWAQNPIVGLFAGLFMTAIVQSSSTVTTMIVTAVAGGVVPLPVAVPMVMGANMGTTVTNTLVAMGSVVRSEEFRRSLQAATVHDFFNFLAVLVLLPLEVISQATGWLRASGGGEALGLLGWMGDRCSRIAAASEQTIGLEKSSAGLGFLFKAPAGLVLDFLARTLSHGDQATAKALARAASAAGDTELKRVLLWTGVLGVLAGLGLLSLCLVVVSKNMKLLVLGRFEGAFQSPLLQNASVCLLIGLLLTVLVQSSSITTSILVPVAAAGLMRLRQVFFVTLGANVGTTCTGLLAALFLVTSGEQGARLGLGIAFVHLLFNVTGITVVLSVPYLRSLPMRLAEGFALVCVRRRLYAMAYLVGVFFAIPGLLLLAWRGVQAYLH